jgi:putative membrane protein
MDGFAMTLVFVHLVANLVWVGSILSVAMVLCDTQAEALTRGKLALGVYRRVAVPAFLISFSAGLLRLLLDLDFYFVTTKFMHGKLTLAAAVVGIHHVIGARAKGLSNGKNVDAGPVATLAIVLLIFAMGAAFFAIFKPF